MAASSAKHVVEKYRRILLISEHGDPLATPGYGHRGGQNVYVRALASRLGACGHSVDVISRAEDPELPVSQPLGRGARVVRIPAGPLAPLPRDRFREVLDEFTSGAGSLWRSTGGYDLIHSHYWYSGLVGLALARSHGVPLVHSHMSLGVVRQVALRRARGAAGLGDEQDLYFAARHDAETRLAREADALTAYCPADVAHQRRLLHTPPQRVHLVPPGVDTTVFTPRDRGAARRQLGLPAHRPIILFVGRLEARKGLADLAAALPRVRAERTDVRLVVVGGRGDPDDPETAAALAHLHANGLDGTAEMRGSVPHDETPLFYSAADVTVVPSHYEPFGLVAIDSLACGTPVVASRVGGLKWIVADDTLGARVRPRDPGDLADAILRVLRRPPGHYSHACVRRVADHFSAERWTLGVQRAYAAVRRP